MSGADQDENPKQNLTSKKKKRKKHKHHDFHEKNPFQSGSSRGTSWRGTSWRGTSSVSQETQPPSAPSLDSGCNPKGFNLSCTPDASFSEENMSFKAVSSSSGSKQDYQEGSASSSEYFIEKQRWRPGNWREKYKGSSKESNIYKGKLHKKNKGFAEKSQNILPNEKSQLPNIDKFVQKGKKLQERRCYSDEGHVNKISNLRENKLHKRKRTLPEGVSTRSPTSNLESNCSKNVSVEVAFGNRLKRQDGLQRAVPQSSATTQNINLNVFTKEPSMTSKDGSANHSTKVKKIPGFYYDKEKKRYFKILPGHIAESSWITTETIKEKETEEKRRNLMKQQNPPKVLNGRSLSAVNILQSMQEGFWNHTQYTRYSTECRVQAMNVTPESVYEPSTELQIAGINPVIQFVELDMSMSKVMVVLGSEQVSRIILGSISKDHGAKKELLLQEWQDVYIRNSTSSQISSAKLINIEQQDSSLPGNLYVLFSWTGDYSNAVQLVKCPSEKDPVSYVGYRFESPGEVISSCSWSSNPRFPAHLCIGFSKEAEIIEILSNSRQRLDTEKKEVLSQVFAKEQPVIYLGLKQGCISSYDLRAPHQPVYAMTHKSPVDKNMTILHGGCVCSLRLLKDENYLLAGSSDGTIKLWDLRQRAVLKEMYGHCNEYKFLPVNVDSSETVVYSVGQDHHTRLWSLQDSSHLKTIPAPVLGTSKTSAVFSMNWGGSGLPGTMIGAENKLFWYPF